MLIVKRVTFFLFLSLVFYTGCQVAYLVPSTPNIPLLDSAQIFNVDFTLTMNYSIEGKTNIKFLKYGIIQASVENKHVMFRKYNFFNYDFATGFNYSKNKINFSIIGGFGKGIVNFGGINESFASSGNGHYNKYYIQPAFSYIKHNNIFGFVFKCGYYDYMVTNLDIQYSVFYPPKILNKFYPVYSTEPTLFFRCNSMPFIYSIYLGFHSFLTYNKELRYYNSFKDKNYLVIGWSLGFYLNKGTLKNKIKYYSKKIKRKRKK